MASTLARARGAACLLGVALVGLIFSAPAVQAQDQAITVDPAAEEATAPRGTNLSFGGIKVSADLPLQVISDELEMDQNVNTAVFVGNVNVEQGDLTLKSARVLVEYGMIEGASRPNQIIRLTASGGVTMTSPSETAEAAQAVYTIATREILMTGDVLVTQGLNTVSGERMVVYLDEGTAVMQGRVRTFINNNAPENPKPTVAAPGPAKEAGQ
ncbi:lipopolysaccharide transport protein LptA [Roseovarius marisflavi]|uniref:Lipopolysaccharide transport protein LptA n=1 Tax=Roseovarius marisflavi TaxID=1054996 RepID=A0A1M6WYB7_9RHOB|nr:LptA/OstA family protein [Roseovarius marisflavi]SHK98555.1 lipopolysaccharide transport protein LptA [Roseovarius marisflavi]